MAARNKPRNNQRRDKKPQEGGTFVTMQPQEGIKPQSRTAPAIEEPIQQAGLRAPPQISMPQLRGRYEDVGPSSASPIPPEQQRGPSPSLPQRSDGYLQMDESLGDPNQPSPRAPNTSQVITLPPQRARPGPPAEMWWLQFWNVHPPGHAPRNMPRRSTPQGEVQQPLNDTSIYWQNFARDPMSVFRGMANETEIVRPGLDRLREQDRQYRMGNGSGSFAEQTADALRRSRTGETSYVRPARPSTGGAPLDNPSSYDINGAVDAVGPGGDIRRPGSNQRLSSRVGLQGETDQKMDRQGQALDRADQEERDRLRRLRGQR